MCPGALAADGRSQDRGRAVPNGDLQTEEGVARGTARPWGARQVCCAGTESRGPGRGDFTGNLPWDGAWVSLRRM